MSGYLRRLVDSVLHSHETVHPRTGSLFAPHRSEANSPVELFGESEMLAAHPAGSESSAVAEAAESVDTADTARQPTARSGHPRQSEARSDRSQSPLLPSVANEPVRASEEAVHEEVAQPARSEAQHDNVTRAIEQPQRFAAPRAQHVVLDSKRGTSADGYVPLIPPTRNEDASARPEASKLSAGASKMRPASVNLPAERSHRAEREPDDIQIHIGRIEVTAVQPPAPRAPKAPDRSISLDAYLERRNGKMR